MKIYLLPLFVFLAWHVESSRSIFMESCWKKAQKFLGIELWTRSSLPPSITTTTQKNTLVHATSKSPPRVHNNDAPSPLRVRNNDVPSPSHDDYNGGVIIPHNRYNYAPSRPRINNNDVPSSLRVPNNDAPSTLRIRKNDAPSPPRIRNNDVSSPPSIYNNSAVIMSRNGFSDAPSRPRINNNGARSPPRILLPPRREGISDYKHDVMLTLNNEMCVKSIEAARVEIIRKHRILTNGERSTTLDSIRDEANNWLNEKINEVRRIRQMTPVTNVTTYYGMQIDCSKEVAESVQREIMDTFAEFEIIECMEKYHISRKECLQRSDKIKVCLTSINKARDLIIQEYTNPLLSPKNKGQLDPILPGIMAEFNSRLDEFVHNSTKIADGNSYSTKIGVWIDCHHTIADEVQDAINNARITYKVMVCGGNNYYH